MTSSFSSRVAVSKIQLKSQLTLKSTLECLFGWSYIILKLHVAARHWDLLLLWTPTAGEIICHFNLWCNHSKETSLRPSLIVIESSELLQRARFIVTLICGGPYAVTIQKKPLWDCHWSSLIVIGRHWSSLSPLNSYSGRDYLSL